MELEELIVEIVIGLFLLFTSYQKGIKENITLLHGYHYTQLDPKANKFSVVFYNDEYDIKHSYNNQMK